MSTVFLGGGKKFLIFFIEWARLAHFPLLITMMMGLNNFLRICRSTLDKLDPREKSSSNGRDCNSSSNNAPFINKTLNLSVKRLWKGQK